ncbi:unnamed protein product [Brassicogethes aeneus]|uniref:Zinc finger PHD-type domain-containing protein n=1 Tax=Brassicogethes aeneus TaxID=1431903 RepID=A0A9P0B0M1_BRAAE|nr:unnamed protein product [Brassicogethes aeneus]
MAGDEDESSERSCKKCNSAVNNDNSVMCSGECKSYFHSDCVQLKKSVLNVLNSVKSVKWFCESCVLLVSVADSLEDKLTRMLDNKLKSALESFEDKITSIFLNTTNVQKSVIENQIAAKNPTALFATAVKQNINSENSSVNVNNASISKSNKVFKNSLVIKSKVKNSDELYTSLKSLVKPSDLPVPVNSIVKKSSGVIINCESAESVSELQKKLGEVLPDDFEMSSSSNVNPKLIAYNISKDDNMENNDEFAKLIIKQNNINTNVNDFMFKIVRKINYKQGCKTVARSGHTCVKCGIVTHFACSKRAKYCCGLLLNAEEDAEVEEVSTENYKLLKLLVSELRQNNKLLLENNKLLYEKIDYLKIKLSEKEKSEVREPKKTYSNAINAGTKTSEPCGGKTGTSKSSVKENEIEVRNNENKSTNSNQKTQVLQSYQQHKMNEIINLANAEGNQHNYKIKQKIKIGTAETSHGTSFTGRLNTDKKAWLFISRVKDSVSDDDIKKHISSKTKCNESDIVVKCINTKYEKKDSKCFQVGVNFALKDQLYETNFWPVGVAFRRYRINFLDNQTKQSPPKVNQAEVSQ